MASKNQNKVGTKRGRPTKIVGAVGHSAEKPAISSEAAEASTKPVRSRKAVEFFKVEMPTKSAGSRKRTKKGSKVVSKNNSKKANNYSSIFMTREMHHKRLLKLKLLGDIDICINFNNILFKKGTNPGSV